MVSIGDQYVYLCSAVDLIIIEVVITPKVHHHYPIIQFHFGNSIKREFIKTISVLELNSSHKL